MYYLINEEKKVVFGWSAKCGCSHVKKIFHFLQNGKIDNPIHVKNEYNKLPENINNYILILFIRNPYERIISGFLDKYKKNGECRYAWTIDDPLTFHNFIRMLSIKNYSVINYHHFTQQTSEEFKDVNHPNLTIYDIKNIDYAYIEKLFNVKIPEELINFRGSHENKGTQIVNYNLCNLHIDDLIDIKPKTSLFYNDYIKNKIDVYYKQDFDFFSKHGFNY
jgi:hypothetical protein